MIVEQATNLPILSMKEEILQMWKAVENEM